MASRNVFSLDCEFGVKFRGDFLVAVCFYSRIMIVCNEWDFPIEIADVGSDLGGHFLVGFMVHFGTRL